MMNTITKTILLFLLPFFTTQAIANCPGCVINISNDIASDTIFLSTVPDGKVGVYYDQDLSFRMPKTTDPVNVLDPSIPAGLSIQSITLLSIVNMPPGLSWESNQTVYDPDEETDGCLKFCGTPIVPGNYEMEFTVSAQVLGISQITSFSVDLNILPSISTTEGFTISNNEGCDEVVVSFENNIPSNGDSGITYLWDFGNGNLSFDENPVSQTYSIPGVFPVNYQMVIDTIGYILTNVKVLDSGCTDLPSFPTFSTAPDMQITIYNPQDSIIFQTEIFDNTFPPIEASMFIKLETGNYRVEVIDDDDGLNFGDDFCGEVTFNQLISGVFTSGEFSLELAIIHPVDTIISMDSVTVYATPEAPIVNAISAPVFCDGEEVTLVASYETGLQWYQDTTLLIGANSDSLTVMEAGFYYVDYVSPQGCQLTSSLFEVEVISLPEVPAFINTENLLSVYDETMLPADYALQWYQNDFLLEGETGLTYCVNEFATYTLEVTNNETSCVNNFSVTVPYNPAFDCNVISSDESFDKTYNFKIFPNPTTDRFTIHVDNPNHQAIQFWMTDLLGRKLAIERKWTTSELSAELDLSEVVAGVYLVYLKVGEAFFVERLMKID